VRVVICRVCRRLSARGPLRTRETAPRKNRRRGGHCAVMVVWPPGGRGDVGGVAPLKRVGVVDL